MHFVQNFPFFSIILSMFAGTVSSVLNAKWAKRLNTLMMGIICVLSVCVLAFCIQTGESYTYMMGHFPAPWGNEIRAGVLEGFMALFFCMIMILSLVGGHKHLEEEVVESKKNQYYILINLLLSSLLALIYTNDLFTAYVFIEINTIAACGLIMIRGVGRTLEAAVRYIIMSSLGSGLLLLGICILYDCTGHLLMSNMKESIARISANGSFEVPLLVAIAFICVGLAIKSALFPFHAWLPDAYSYSTVSSSAILSSLVSKGYIFLLIKIIYRVIGFEVIFDSKIMNMLFVFGLAGMIMGSLSAIKEKDIRRMIAYSSVAQIGYIYMGIGMGSEAGMVAAVFHILCHAATKSLLFIAQAGLTDVSGNSKKFVYLTGAAYRNKIAGVAFLVGSLSMVGIPGFAGFVSKLLFAQASINDASKMLPTLLCLAASTILNAVYFLKTVVRLYTPVKTEYETIPWTKNKRYALALVLFIILNFVLGMMSDPIVELIKSGLAMFS